MMSALLIIIALGLLNYFTINSIIVFFILSLVAAVVIGPNKPVEKGSADDIFR